MRRVWSLVALGTLALGASGVPARAAFIEFDGRQASRATPVSASPVTAVSIVAAAGRAEVVIAVAGPVDVRDFTVDNPDRIVLDLTGARLDAASRAYDGIVRAGIANVRMSQFRPEVVRIVLDLESARDYSVARGDRDVRVSIATSEQFSAWHSTGTKLEVALSNPPNVDTVAAVRPDSALAPQKASTGIVDSILAPLSGLQQRPQAQRITVTYNEADIRAVLAAFSGFSNRTIVVGKDVQGTVTAEIKDQPWDVALQAILQAQGLAASEDASGIITVDSYQNILQKQASEPLTTQIIKINYARAASLV
ncbi:MAG: AMIN domain-containing protein, partial [Gemmatimonadaceae bacterium]